MKYVSVAEMIRIEKAADASGHTYEKMMEAAGKGLAEYIQKKFDGFKRKRITALVGSGNNGGDALVALDYLSGWGWHANAIIFKERPSDDPLVQRVVDCGGKITHLTDPATTKSILKEQLGQADLVLDGVLGTGITLPLREPVRSLLDMTKTIIGEIIPKPIVLAVDCPSGTDCDGGAIAQEAIPADVTVTMAAVKQGLLKFPAYEYLGALVLVDIDLPDSLPEMNQISREVVTPSWVKNQLPDRPANAHKGTFGTLLIIAGSENYPGAAFLAGVSAYRCGVGLVQMAVPDVIYSGLIGAFPEGTWIPIPTEQGGITGSFLKNLNEYLSLVDALLVGPGFGTAKGTGQFVNQLLETKDLPPLVLDADGLRLARDYSNWPDHIPAGSILTPHPGEMAALTGLTVAEVQSDRVGVAEEYARIWKQIVVLKGAHTVVADYQGETKIIESADPALATAGSGDVLAGMIAALVAQGLKPFTAACCGGWIHAKAGALARNEHNSSASVLAGDISLAIGRSIPK
jgi:NAD(P)H-hydrate epimerase